MVKTWNSGFNEAAATCGLGVCEVLGLKDGTRIGETLWSRRGSKVSVCIGTAVWTVDEADIQGAANAEPARVNVV